MGNIRYQRTAHRITSAVNCRPLKPSPRSICPAAPYTTGVHIPGTPPPAKFATQPTEATRIGWTTPAAMTLTPSDRPMPGGPVPIGDWEEHLSWKDLTVILDNEP